MIYYEFNRTGNGGKYKEMTEAEYELAMQDPNRYFLEGWDEPHKKLLYMIECSREVFDQVRHEQYGIEYRQRDKSNRKAVVLSLEQDVDDCGEACSVFGSGTCPVDEQVQMELFGEYVKSILLEALSLLKSDERYILTELALKNRTMESVGKSLGVSKAAISQRYQRIRRKLRTYLQGKI